jgi:hypothetical protein
VAPSQLHLSVQWPDGRTVSVDILVGLERDAITIGDDDLATRQTLLTFLAWLTRERTDSSSVEVVCTAPDAGRLLDLLGVTDPPPSSIPVVLERMS